MASQFDEAFAVVQSLAKDFEANKAAYLSAAYQESEVRKDFIDKFLIALGWDVNHDQQKNPFEQEVKVERGVNVHGSQRRADYAFYIAPNFRDVRFYTEAKKPFADIATADNYFQTIRYGWNSQTPLAILTDFAQFHILDCRYKPNIETALAQNIRKYVYADYTKEPSFREIFHLFSREAVANGSLDKFAETLANKRGRAVQRGLFTGAYQSFDDAFLTELDEHRDTLARTFKARNQQLDGETLTEITQRTLDRLVFMRFLEDKLIHPDRLVANFGDKGTAWQDFIAASRKLDGIYNGIVFKKHDILDSPAFNIDDNAFSDICEELAHINSPYDFNLIPIHILGSIYERFLGNVIEVTEKRAKVVQKPEVRKAGGVNYTPAYVSRYIVENTVGRLIKGKTPEQIALMRFIDIACGSGSFLIALYDLLLRYIRDWYNAHPDRAKKDGCVLRSDGAWHLSLKQRREILLHNIYGVDIDHQAVEVCQLSLYLKLLEEETVGTAHDFQLEFHETLLPSLNKNIVCGNSLIGTDILTGQLFASDDERRLNPMDFEQRFPEIMKAGGFDGMVGNPPYVDVKGLPPLQVRYIFEHFDCANNRINLFAAFIERGLKLCKKTGSRFSFIVPTALLTQDSYKALRKVIVQTRHVVTVARLPNESFGRAAGEVKVDTMILVIDDDLNSKSSVEVFTYAGYARIMEIDPNKATVHTIIPQSVWAEAPDCIWSLNLPANQMRLLSKIERNTVALEDCADFCLGLTPYDKYKGHTQRQIEEQVFHAVHKKDKSYKKLLSGNDVMRYHVSWNGQRWISYGPWLGAPREHRFFTEKRILVKQIIDWTSKRIWAALTSEELYNTQNAFNLIAKSGRSPEFLIAVINSRLMTF
jgi:type I restriction-modification system DNA methylase subunit